MSIREEFQEVRQRALDKIATPANLVMAKNFLETVVIPKLREQQSADTTANYLGITFCLLKNGTVTCNSRANLDYHPEDGKVFADPEVLTIAVENATAYDIDAYKFCEESITLYRFELYL